jgi:hypothetical protein
MSKHIKRGAVLLTLILFAVIYLATPLISSTTFNISNKTSENIIITAYWRNKEKDLGVIKSSSTYKFNVSDEAAMKFKVKYMNGKILESKEIYFTSGLVINVNVLSDSIEVNYN